MNFRGLDLNLLVAMDALLTERSTTRAGERVYLSQSAMSGALGRLRAFFDDELLIQVGQRMVLTPLAEDLVNPVREALLAIEKVVNKDQVFDPGTSSRRFRIMMSDYAAVVLMTRAMPAIQQMAPNVAIELVSNSELALPVSRPGGRRPPDDRSSIHVEVAPVRRTVSRRLHVRGVGGEPGHRR